MENIQSLVYPSPADAVRALAPEGPLAIARPQRVTAAGTWFRENFPGEIFYAVKANPSSWVLDALWAAGVRGFDVASDSDSASLTVSDTGSGIPEPERERVFDRFVQLDAARSGPGSGLGLAIARMIARLHGGELWTEPSTCGGAAFWMRLPRARPAEHGGARVAPTG